MHDHYFNYTIIAVMLLSSDSDCVRVINLREQTKWKTEICCCGFSVLIDVTLHTFEM